MKYYNKKNKDIHENTIFSNSRRVIKNQKKHPHPRAKYLFGIDLDMSGMKSNLLLNPIVAIPRYEKEIRDMKVLSIGPRNEGEIFNIMSYGFKKQNITSLDLFSYSPLIDVGDMHNMQYQDNQFDIIILGWVLAYSNNKEKVASEIVRVAKDDAIIAIGSTYSPISNEEQISLRGYLVASEERIYTVNDILNYFKNWVNNIYFRCDIPEKYKNKHGQNLVVFSINKNNEK